jgi:hypothetical protein
MSSSYKETWAEIKAGLGLFFKVCGYSVLALIGLSIAGFIAFKLWCP